MRIINLCLFESVFWKNKVVFFIFQSYIEDFYQFCKSLGGATEEVMCELLAVCIEKLIILIELTFI